MRRGIRGRGPIIPLLWMMHDAQVANYTIPQPLLDGGQGKLITTNHLQCVVGP
jgi:hypothetical protein